MIHLLVSFAGAYCLTAIYAMFRGKDTIDIIHVGLLSGFLAIVLRYYIFDMLLGIPL